MNDVISINDSVDEVKENLQRKVIDYEYSIY